MTVLAMGWAVLTGPMLRLLARIPPRAWVAGGALLLLLAGWRWHGAELRAARAGGAAVQAAADRRQFEAAGAEATRRQAALKSALAARQAIISKGTDDALAARNADLARGYADLRLRWAAWRAAAGGAGEGGAIAVSGAAADAGDTACAARGWVDFNTAAAAAQAADAAIAKDDAWIAWAQAQAVAWPRD